MKAHSSKLARVVPGRKAGARGERDQGKYRAQRIIDCRSRDPASLCMGMQLVSCLIHSGHLREAYYE